jgi:type II secretory pathway component GspD/PulD (secretin)
MHRSGWTSRGCLTVVSSCTLLLAIVAAASSTMAADQVVSAAAGARTPQHIRKVAQPPTGFLSRTKSALSGLAEKISSSGSQTSEPQRPLREARSPARSADRQSFHPFERIRQSLSPEKKAIEHPSSRDERRQLPAPVTGQEASEIPVFDHSLPPFDDALDEQNNQQIVGVEGPSSPAWFPNTTVEQREAAGRVRVGSLGDRSESTVGRVVVGNLPVQRSQPAGRATINQTGEPSATGRVSIQRLSGDDTESRGGRRQIRIPINDAAGTLSVGGSGNRISLSVREASLSEVLGLVAEQHGLNIVTASSVTGTISVSLVEVELEDVLDAILTVNGYTWVRQKNIILVSKLDQQSPVSHIAQGRQMRVFSLTYVAGTDIDAVVKGLLSPVGQSFVTTQSAQDKRKTQEQIVVEDLPQYLERVESYIAQADQPPRQVLIEAHILRVDLADNLRHGVDLQGVARLAGAKITLSSKGFANPAASPAFLFGVDGTDLDTLIEALQTTTDAKTLASPKVLAVNGQEARIQVGERLGYLVTTTTQTSTLQSVNFLDTGIVLTVTPIIGESGQILMNIVPKISSGRVNPDTGLPEEETTDVQTTVMLHDGQAMIIGGLITETDIDLQSKVPIAGDLWGVGRLFQRRVQTTERSEIIIALIPRIVPYESMYDAKNQCDIHRATTPLTEWPLQEAVRDVEPSLPDAMKLPRKPRWNRILDVHDNLEQENPRPSEYFFPSRQDAWYYEDDE